MLLFASAMLLHGACSRTELCKRQENLSRIKHIGSGSLVQLPFALPALSLTQASAKICFELHGGSLLLAVQQPIDTSQAASKHSDPPPCHQFSPRVLAGVCFGLGF